MGVFRIENTGLGERLRIKFVKYNTFFADVSEEISPFLDPRVHLTQRMDNEVYRSLHITQAHKPVFGFSPELKVRQLTIVDDNQQVKIRTIAFAGMRFIHLCAARIRSEQNGLVECSPPFHRTGRLV
ncbi:hypothetical protein Q644_17570 [Brucella intermedia 229E]|uniref:Uncharacterized protein n=1 Tax=Brucella intermedia 229E TaxID=1337887 RepID=U4VHF0_9HYPH|nr:hypothetical protein Q644_17570 [Brucella intermedia 229E]